MATKLANNAVSRLVMPIAPEDTTISITSGHGIRFPALGPDDWFPLTLVKADGSVEIVYCTERTGDTLTVTRAREGTVARSFSVGDRVELRMTIYTFEQAIADEIAAAMSQAGLTDIASAFPGNNCNNATIPGLYQGTADAVNSPWSGSAPFSMIVIKLAEDAVTQYAMSSSLSPQRTAIRSMIGGAWGTWTVFANDWSLITGKPSTFPPAAHTHNWEQIGEKPTTFPPSAHGHTWSEISEKPTTFPPIIGSGANQAKAGNWTPSASDIPSLDASKIATGTLHTDRIPGLNASKITSGTIESARVQDVSGNAASATKLKTPRTINGISFDGSANIVVPTAPATLGAVGSYAFMLSMNQVAPGSTVAGVNLRYTSVSNNGSVSPLPPTPSGTWRAMGEAREYEGFSTKTVFQRIS